MEPFDGTRIRISLLAMAHAQFPQLMRHPDFQEDAKQELRLCQLMRPDPKACARLARWRLARLEYELGVTPEPRRVLRPRPQPPRRSRKISALVRLFSEKKSRPVPKRVSIPEPSFYEQWKRALDFDSAA